jgi:hypothetical protein
MAGRKREEAARRRDEVGFYPAIFFRFYPERFFGFILQFFSFYPASFLFLSCIPETFRFLS